MYTSIRSNKKKRGEKIILKKRKKKKGEKNIKFEFWKRKTIIKKKKKIRRKWSYLNLPKFEREKRLAFERFVFTEQGFCMRGDLCPYDHGTDPVIVEDVSVPSYPPPSGKVSGSANSMSTCRRQF